MRFNFFTGIIVVLQPYLLHFPQETFHTFLEWNNRRREFFKTVTFEQRVLHKLFNLETLTNLLKFCSNFFIYTDIDATIFLTDSYVCMFAETQKRFYWTLTIIHEHAINNAPYLQFMRLQQWRCLRPRPVTTGEKIVFFLPEWLIIAKFSSIKTKLSLELEKYVERTTMMSSYRGVAKGIFVVERLLKGMEHF